jgi:hypothetical protein
MNRARLRRATGRSPLTDPSASSDDERTQIMLARQAAAAAEGAMSERRDGGGTSHDAHLDVPRSQQQVGDAQARGTRLAAAWFTLSARAARWSRWRRPGS